MLRCPDVCGARSATIKRGFLVDSFALLLLMLVLLPWPAGAQSTADEFDAILSGFDTGDVQDLDDALGGFADEPGGGIPAVPAAEPGSMLLPDWLAVQGALAFGASANYAHEPPAAGRTDHRGISRLKSTFSLISDLSFSPKWRGRVAGHAFYDFAYRINGHDNYTDEMLGLYEDEVELDECYLQGSPWSRLDVKTGRQIVVWGKADNIRVTDIWNPLDNREPGLVDIRDLRLPVAMSKVDYYLGAWNLSGIMVHEIRFNKDPVFDSDFFPGALPAPAEEKPSASMDHQEFGLALNGIFSGWDVSFYGAAFYSDTPHLALSTTGPVRRHSRLKMAGMAVNIAAGNWLLKGEAAYLEGLEYFNAADTEKSRLDLLLGLEYNGLSDTVIGLEAANRHLFDYTDALQLSPDETKEDEVQATLRISRDFLHDTLTLSLLVSLFGTDLDEGGFQRFTFEYDWSDSIDITVGLINYTAGERLMWKEIGDNDRIFLQLRYAFASGT